jgi:hypothetical protein
MLRLRTLFLAGVLLGLAVPASAGRSVGTEWWLGGGFNRPDYRDGQVAVIRGGGGVLFFEHVGIGANLQADREHWFAFGYASIIFPAIASVEPYGRFHAGQRDDVDDTALGWTGGLRTGDGKVKLFVEAFGVIEPGYGTGVAIGITF